jgi:hypothetical protein
VGLIQEVVGGRVDGVGGATCGGGGR